MRKLKIDQSFIKDIANIPDNEAITRVISTVAKALVLTVLTEGGETEEACVLLKNLWCDAVQGYYVSMPLPADEFSALLGRAGTANEVQSRHASRAGNYCGQKNVYGSYEDTVPWFSTDHHCRRMQCEW